MYDESAYRTNDKANENDHMIIHQKSYREDGRFVKSLDSDERAENEKNNRKKKQRMRATKDGNGKHN